MESIKIVTIILQKIIQVLIKIHLRDILSLKYYLIFTKNCHNKMAQCLTFNPQFEDEGLCFCPDSLLLSICK